MEFLQCIRAEQSRVEVCNLSVNLSRGKNKFKDLKAVRGMQTGCCPITQTFSEYESLDWKVCFLKNITLKSIMYSCAVCALHNFMGCSLHNLR